MCFFVFLLVVVVSTNQVAMFWFLFLLFLGFLGFLYGMCSFFVCFWFVLFFFLEGLGVR